MQEANHMRIKPKRMNTNPLLTQSQQKLFADLCQRRVELATRPSRHTLAIDHTLKRIAQLRPQRLEDLRKSTATTLTGHFGYAAEWLAVVHKFHRPRSYRRRVCLRSKWSLYQQ